MRHVTLAIIIYLFNVVLVGATMSEGLSGLDIDLKAATSFQKFLVLPYINQNVRSIHPDDESYYNWVWVDPMFKDSVDRILNNQDVFKALFPRPFKRKDTINSVQVLKQEVLAQGVPLATPYLDLMLRTYLVIDGLGDHLDDFLTDAVSAMGGIAKNKTAEDLKKDVLIYMDMMNVDIVLEAINNSVEGGLPYDRYDEIETLVSHLFNNLDRTLVSEVLADNLYLQKNGQDIKLRDSALNFLKMYMQQTSDVQLIPGTKNCYLGGILKSRDESFMQDVELVFNFSEQMPAGGYAHNPKVFKMNISPRDYFSRSPVDALLRIVYLANQATQNVFFHCIEGKNRSATAAVAVSMCEKLMKEEVFDPERVVAEIKTVRGVIGVHLSDLIGFYHYLMLNLVPSLQKENGEQDLRGAFMREVKRIIEAQVQAGFPLLEDLEE